MKRSTKILFGLFAFSGLAFVGLLVAMIFLAMRANHPPLEDGSLLVLDLTGDVADRAPEQQLAFPGMGRSNLTLFELREALQRAANDRHIRALVLTLSGTGVGWATGEELREAIAEFKASGKQVAAYLEAGGDMDYFIACAADKIYLAPEGSLYVNGLALEAQFYHDLLAKLGVEAEFHHIGDFKTAPDSYQRMSMSERHREVLNALADGLFERLVAAISQGRSLPTERVQALIDEFQPAGPALVEVGLIDGLMYPDQVYESLAGGTELPPLIHVDDYLKAVQPADPGGKHLAVLFISGEIRSGESDSSGILGGSAVGSDTIVAALSEIEEDPDIEGILVRVDSPGGSALAADLMWRAITRYKEKTGKPVIVSMSDLTASGGYWIATAGDVLVAQPTTLTGSIGVFFGKFNIPVLLEKIGANIETVSRGRHAEMFSATRRFNEGEVARINQWLKLTYDSFLSRVAQSRGLSLEEAHQVAQGRVWTGAQAREHKLVDELGGMKRGLELLHEKTGTSPQSVGLKTFPQSGTVFERIARQLGAKAGSELPPLVNAALKFLSAPRRQDLFLDPGPQVLLPFSLQIQ